MAVLVDLTGNHLRIARHAAERAQNDPSQALAAVVFAAAAFESWLAAFVTHAQRHAEHDPPPVSSQAIAIARTVPALERANAQWLLKLQVTCVLLSGHPLDRGAQPWQDIELLFRIRNLILHPSLKWDLRATDDLSADSHVIIRALVSRGIVPEPCRVPGVPGTSEEGRELFAPPMAVLLRPEIGAWAERTAALGIQAVAALCPPSIFRSQIRYLLEHFVLGEHIN